MRFLARHDSAFFTVETADRVTANDVAHLLGQAMYGKEYGVTTDVSSSPMKATLSDLRHAHHVKIQEVE